jgi:hypothetical protein
MRKIASLFGCLIATLALGTAQPLVIDFFNETEGNDSITLANNLGVVGVDSTNTRRMKVVYGLINPDGDNDYFRVELAQNGTYSFRVDCTLDSVLTLYNASGTLIAENDDDEIGNNNRGNRDTSFTNADSGITISLNAGVYYVRVRSITTAGVLARFRYTLRIFDGSTARDFDPYEVDGTNETFGTATDVGNLADDFTLIPNGFLRYRQTDFDFYRIEIGAGGLTVRTIGATDTVVAVFDSAFNPLADKRRRPARPVQSLHLARDAGQPARRRLLHSGGRVWLFRGARGRLVRCANHRLHALCAASYRARINFDRADLSLVPFDMKIYQAGTQNLQYARTFRTNASGNFTTYTSIMSGTVDIAVRAPTSLTRIVRGVSLNSNVSGLVFNLINGDLNGDNVIDDADLLIVLFNFGSNDAATDLNGDGVY